ncbi:lethal (3) 80Fj [Brevipalpus obovatus]|uniref:lethal (3) 80Fj n=1 Tax=Brevipalpus obovatus TaxID=246614 RepID=UPI003D9E14C9
MENFAAHIETLRAAPIRVLCTGTHDRRKLFDELNSICIDVKTLDETNQGQVVKRICDLLPSTLQRYQQRRSRQMVVQLIRQLSTNHADHTMKHLSKALINFFKNLRDINATESTAKLCLTALNWTTLVITAGENCGKLEDDIVRSIIDLQSFFVYVVTVSSKPALRRKMYAILCKFWSKSFPIGSYTQKLSNATIDSTNCLCYFVLWGFVFQNLSECRNTTAISNCKPFPLDILLKHMAASKYKLPIQVITEGSPAFLKQVNHDDFRDKLLPTLKRAILRNPEISLEFTSHLLSRLSMDLSPYGPELGKIFGTHLVSKEEDLIRIAVDGTKMMVHQCSDSTAVEELINHYFNVLNGSEGKLTVITQRLGALSGIGALSYNQVSGGSSEALTHLVCDKMVKFLSSEIHEGTLIHGSVQMRLWCVKLKTSGQIPSSLIDRTKDISSAKNVSPLVKSAHFACLNAALNETNIEQATDLLSMIIPSAQKVIGASVTQIPLVIEGLYASTFIVKCFHRDKQLELKHKNVLNGLLEFSKIPFLLEKFVNQVDSEAQSCLMQFVEETALNYENRLKESLKSLCPTLIYLAVLPHQFDVRREALKVCQRLLSTICEVDFFQYLMTSLKEAYGKYEIPSDSNDTNEASENASKSLNVKALIKLAKTACQTASTVANNNATKNLINSFLALHVPIIHRETPRLWIEYLKSLMDQSKLDVFLRTKTSEFCCLIFEEEHNLPLQCNCLKTLAIFFPDNFLDRFISKINNIMANSDFKTVTVEEYEIFKTPEGQLWDYSVVEAKKDDISAKNLKRESKLYSYKEQLAEMEIRREIEKKKMKSNPDKEPPLNEKQLAAKKIQLEKESMIRERLKGLHNEMQLAVNYLYALRDGNEVQLACRTFKVLPPLVNLMQSPLCSELACESFINLGRIAFIQNPSPHLFDKSIGYATLRQLKPFSPLDEGWLKEDLNSMLSRLIGIVHTNTCAPQERDFDEQKMEQIEAMRFTSSAIAYCFPLFSSILAGADKDPDLVEKVIEIIHQHTFIRSTGVRIDPTKEPNEALIILRNPQYLPRNDMLIVLFKFMEKPIPHLEPLSMTTIRAIAACSNGKPNAAKVSKEEILTYLEAIKKEQETIRDVALDSLIELADYLRTIKDTSVRTALRQRIWVIRFDTQERIQEKARKLWDLCDLENSPHLCALLIEDLNEARHNLRLSIADAIEGLLSIYPNEIKSTANRLMDRYKLLTKQPVRIMDTFGRSPESQSDNYEPRLGVAIALNKIAPLLNDSLVMELARFLVPQALDDRNEHVQCQMLEVGITLADKQGPRCMTSLLALLRKNLDKDGGRNGNVKRSLVILMGTLARHLDKNDDKIKPIVGKLIATLSTPSEIVQEAVANCLPPLVPAFKEDAPMMVQKLLQLLLESDKHAERRGAAHGIAGMIKGLGILSLKQLGITEALGEAVQSKKNSNHREGALFAFERLCVMLGRLFEPYIIQIIPKLLLCFGDSNPKVRKAADDTAKAFMMKLGALGIKLVLPSLLEGIESESWRTKTGSIELLGAMAYCAPKQLSSFLPSIVPRLMTVLSDSHPKVQEAGEQALKQIGSVIRNPEIQIIVPILLEALQDPANKTQKCLTTMLNTKFVHFIDAPSLALIMPVIERAFQGRSTETRKMAAQIIGNMYSLTDQKDLTPYLSSVIPGLKQSLLDPVPEVRAVTARALGAMVRGIGADVLETLMPWLMETLTCEGSSVDRSGAAQGLAEVMGGLGLERLDQLMPEIIATAERPETLAHVRDGYIMLFIYLPVVFGKEFIPYISRIINPVLKALADEAEFVRETALKAGQRIVNMYAETAIQLLLPQLEKGLFDDNWRIRYSSVQLLGDLLFKLSGVSGKMTTETADEDDNFGTEQSYGAIITCLGLERRNRVLSGLYMGRCDVTLPVRQAALHVWKIVVSNTPRTLKEIMPTLFSLLLGCLASNSQDKQKIAARTLGDLVKKLGERVLPEIIPILEHGLKSDRPDQRQGVCIGLSEIIASTSREMVQAFFDSLMPTVTKALYDPLSEVRQAAAKTFDSLHSAVGSRALDEIMPPLLKQLNDPVLGEFTLDGLKQVMAIKSRVVLPYLVPQLTQPPVNTRALALLATVAGESLSRHLGKILPALLFSLSKVLDTSEEKIELDHCQSVILSVLDDQGTRTIIDHLLESARNDSVSVRRASVQLLYIYCCQSKTAFGSMVLQLIRGLILLFTDSNEQVLQLSWEALQAVTKNLDPREQIECLNEVRNAVRHVASDLKSSDSTKILLPGFCLDKGITPIMPIFREALLNGNTEQKELAAEGLYQVIELTSSKALEPSVLHIVGTSIRILGDRYPWSVKVAVLNTLSLLISKQSTMTTTLRTFVPQLKQTFLKALVDPNRILRLRAAYGLSHLIAISHNQCIPVLQDIHNSIKNQGSNDDQTHRETMIFALRLGINAAGSNLPDNIGPIMATIQSLLDHSNDGIRTASAACLGSLCRWLPMDKLRSFVENVLLEDDNSSDWTYRHGQSIALRIALKEASDRLLIEEWCEKIAQHLLSQLGSDRIPIVCSGAKACAYFFQHEVAADHQLPQPLVSCFAKCMNHSSNEVKQCVANSSVFTARSLTKPLPSPFLKALVPLLVNGTKEKNSMVKACSEQALVSVLRLRHGEETVQSLCTILEKGGRDSLQDCINKVLRKILSQPEPKEEQFDETIIG